MRVGSVNIEPGYFLRIIPGMILSEMWCRALVVLYQTARSSLPHHCRIYDMNHNQSADEKSDYCNQRWYLQVRQTRNGVT